MSKNTVVIISFSAGRKGTEALLERVDQMIEEATMEGNIEALTSEILTGKQVEKALSAIDQAMKGK